MLKPFLPQLQTTFVKALNDPTQAVREKAAWALGLLTVLHTRVDSLFTELKNGIRNNDDSGIRWVVDIFFEFFLFFNFFCLKK